MEDRLRRETQRGSAMDSWLEQHLVCPADHSDVSLRDGSLVCSHGHAYPYVDGIPVMLLEEDQKEREPWCEVFDRIGEEVESEEVNRGATTVESVDPFVQRAVAGTNGQMYRPLIGKLTRYPIPALELPQGSGQRFLDIGCNWGRWCISAAQLGYAPVGIDPSLPAVRAARRVASQLGLPATYVVADARHLPFRPDSFDVAFSYSVLQHLEKGAMRQCLGEIARTLKAGGFSLIQLPNIWGVRSIFNRFKRAFRQRTPYEVTYYTPFELKTIFRNLIGPTSISVDGYFSLDPQLSDVDLLPLRYRAVVYSSTTLKKISRWIPGMMYFADSVYVKSVGVRQVV